MTHFTDLGLIAPILKALSAQGYEQPTPIQAQAIPPVLKGGDVLGLAQTGTGKTAAFALPILQRLSANPRRSPKACRVLVLAPTRELASQIGDSFRAYGQGLGLTVAVVYGGQKYGAQIKALSLGPDVLVATPGRLIDHMQRGTLDLGKTEILVLDEVDQMLDLGFVMPIRKIVAKLPKDRQTLFFSATMPAVIEKLASEFLRDPVRVAVTPVASTVEKVTQKVLFVESANKADALIDLFEEKAMNRVIIFTRTKRGADRLAKRLDSAGVSASAIHGDKSQGQRERALAGFKGGNCRALVATDIAARGIDIDDISHVVNFELPYVAEAYVHRIGRTARAGRAGIAISLCASDERGLLKDIEKLTRQDLGGGGLHGDSGRGQSPKPRQGQPQRQRPQAKGRPGGHSSGGYNPAGQGRGGGAGGAGGDFRKLASHMASGGASGGGEAARSPAGRPNRRRRSGKPGGFARQG